MGEGTRGSRNRAVETSVSSTNDDHRQSLLRSLVPPVVALVRAMGWHPPSGGKTTSTGGEPRSQQVILGGEAGVQQMHSRTLLVLLYSQV
jgi:hypothetical protein